MSAAKDFYDMINKISWSVGKNKYSLSKSAELTIELIYKYKMKHGDSRRIDTEMIIRKFYSDDDRQIHYAIRESLTHVLRASKCYSRKNWLQYEKVSLNYLKNESYKNKIDKQLIEDKQVVLCNFFEKLINELTMKTYMIAFNKR